MNSPVQPQIGFLLCDVAFFFSKVSMGLNVDVDTAILLSFTIRGMKFMLVRTSRVKVCSYWFHNNLVS